jgi:hypothetical protein
MQYKRLVESAAKIPVCDWELRRPGCSTIAAPEENKSRI